MWRRIVYLKRKIWNFESEAQMNKIEIGKSAAIVNKAQKELDMAKLEAGNLSSVVTKLLRRLDQLEDLRGNGSNQPVPLNSGSDDCWGPRPDLGRPGSRIEAPRSDDVPSTPAAPARATFCPQGAAERRSVTSG